MSAGPLLSDRVELDRKARVKRERLEDIMTALNPDWMEDFEGDLDLAVTTYRTHAPAAWMAAEAKVGFSWRPLDYAISSGIAVITFTVLVVWAPMCWIAWFIKGR